MNKNRKLILTGLLIAASVVLSRFFSIRTSIITFGFGFVPLMIAGILLGWKRTCFISTVSDIIGALLFPSGSFFFGFTISAFLSGLVYGLLLYRENFKIDKSFIIRLIIATFIVNGLINGVLNTIWVMMIVSDASKIIVTTRIIKEIIQVPIKVFTMILLGKLLEPKFQELMND